MQQTFLELITWGIFYSFFIILLIWGILIISARNKRWAEEDRLKKEQEASQA